MAEETKAFDSNTKTQLSLAAALFFSPLVHIILKNNTRDLSDHEKSFIRGYIKFGYLTLFFGFITIAAGILHYLFVQDIFNIIYTTSISLLLALLIIGMISILSDISLIKGTLQESQEYALQGKKKDIILTYLPIYNLYLRYQSHSFEKPNRRIKESILWRILFTILCIFGNSTISSILIIVIILRITSLILEIDIIPITIKRQLNKLFLKNPEELRGYITGFLVYLGKSFIHLFTTIAPYTLDQEIAKEKESYSRIVIIQNNRIIVIEYLIGLLLSAAFLFFLSIDFSIWTYYLGFGLIILRYLIMGIHLKHLPHLPVAWDIIRLFQLLGSLFK